ncbi:MAG: hypothetical protein JHC76_10245 [Akkermansiaceae bacterium]|nr:hypothetical protein [Akkermansiaceae bacterium]
MIFPLLGVMGASAVESSIWMRCDTPNPSGASASLLRRSFNSTKHGWRTCLRTIQSCKSSRNRIAFLSGFWRKHQQVIAAIWEIQFVISSISPVV